VVEILYFANPMCSWCWGFAPVIARLRKEHGEAIRLTVALGSLGDGRRPMRPQDKASAREHWEHVTALTGQPFDFAFFDREGFVYDTEPACRATAVVRGLDPDLALPYLHALHRAFYVENRDITRIEELTVQAVRLGVDGGAFERAFADPATRAATAEEMAETAHLGVVGYPTLLALADGRTGVLALGCKPYAEVEAALTPFLA
jgi:putative protein-disulfide isomerase